MSFVKCYFLLILTLTKGEWIVKDPFSSPQQVPKNLKFGDVMLTSLQQQAMKDGRNTMGLGNAFNGVTDVDLRWKDAVIPYEIDCSIENLEDAVDAVMKAMEEWENKTCIRFVKHTNEKYFLNFMRDSYCYGYVGQTNLSSISVAHNCEYQHVMTHELGHAVGFHHEHIRKDRDEWVEIHWENIDKRMIENFDIVDGTSVYGVPYDYGSIMHYPWDAFSNNSKDTMTPKKDTLGKIPYVELSKGDIAKVSRMYNCPEITKKRERVHKKGHGGTQYRSKNMAKRNSVASLRQASIASMLADNIHGPRESFIVWTPLDDPDDSCTDDHVHCKVWAKYGYCSINDFTRQNCKLSCGAPSCKKSLPCTDNNVHCKIWAQYGYCKINEFTRKNCKLSCEPSCKEVKTTPGPTTQPPTNPSTAPLTKLFTSNPPTKPSTEALTFPPTDSSTRSSTGSSTVPQTDPYTNPPTDPSIGPSTETSTGPLSLSTDPFKVASTSPSALSTNPPIKPPSNEERFFLGKGRLCVDSVQNCAELAKNGDCENRVVRMRQNCMKTCGFTKCDPTGMKPEGSCANPLGLSWDGTSNIKIPDSAFYSPTHLSRGGWEASARNARLYFQDDYSNKRIGGWCAANEEEARGEKGYLQVDLQRERTITYIATQGRWRYFERIRKFKIQYSIDGNNYATYKVNDKDKVFDGNCDHVTPVVNRFVNPIKARYIRYIPIEWNFPCVRLEFYGC